MTPLIYLARDDTSLQTTRVKKVNDKRMAEKPINESEFCLAGKKQSGPVSSISEFRYAYTV